MYNNPVAPSLAMTGLALTGGNIFWWFLAAFALIAVGAAILRIVPRRGGSRQGQQVLEGESWVTTARWQ